MGFVTLDAWSDDDDANGSFHGHGGPPRSLDDLEGKIHLQMDDDWGYTYFRTIPRNYIAKSPSSKKHTQCVVRSNCCTQCTRTSNLTSQEKYPLASNIYISFCIISYHFISYLYTLSITLEKNKYLKIYSIALNRKSE